MSKPYRVGITGGIGSGKTIVCQLFSLLGIPVYDADTAAKSIMASDGLVIEKIKSTLGVQAYSHNQVNNKFIAQAIYNNQELLQQLNQIVHPAVAIHFEQWTTTHPQAPYILKEAALIFESGTSHALDKVIVVTAPTAQRLQHIVMRDPHRTREQALTIIEKQLPDEIKISMADDVIYNDACQLVIPQVLALHHKYLLLSSRLK